MEQIKRFFGLKRVLGKLVNCKGILEKILIKLQNNKSFSRQQVLK